MRIVDLAVDPYSITLDSSNFDFGIYLEYTKRGNDLKKQEELDRYVELSITQNTFTWEFNSTTKRHEQIRRRIMTPLETCAIGRLQT